MAENTIPKKNIAYTFYVSLVDSASRPNFRANPTLAAGDVQVSTDGGAYGNLTTLPVVTPATGRAVKVDLSAAEMNGDNANVQFIDAAGGEGSLLRFMLEHNPKATGILLERQSLVPNITIPVDLQNRMQVQPFDLMQPWPATARL